MSTGPIKIQPQQTLSLKVVEIIENAKCFPTRTGSMKCRHDIVCVDKEGNTSTFEYITPQGAEIMFQVGVYQLVRCVYANEKGITVEPVVDGSHPHLIEASQPRQNKDSNTLKIGGACYTFALGFAKDIFAGIVRRAEINTEVPTENIDMVIQIAEEIQSLLVVRLGEVGEDVNHYAAQVGGSSYIFALGFAKDILLAEIAVRDIDSTVRKSDIIRMFNWADKFQKNMTERFTF